ncbi:patatin-like protein [Paracoccus laeviglucosivorans]|uniref:Patatin-related protein n=1 Tax=Paracoccus laeviglucosivorans TaxID=1197861 RepID=A0A521FCS3_9RHOB|nr:patatin-like protein [Paracoccus laeviglucosivorans]SMO93965.1 patatin-related protein [Paracoccus laeviglucosivorans]
MNASPTADPHAESLSITHEVRFAIVLYGGTSLAIYMHGVSQELLRMVRGSAEIPLDDLDPVERIYRELSVTMPMPNTPEPRGRCRFVIDIISGTSAGGINGVALAKALVCGNRDLSALCKAWTDQAAIGNLLNDSRSRARGKTSSLLDGEKMFNVLLDTLKQMSDERTSQPLVGNMLDLCVTATDLAGRRLPIQLSGGAVYEPVHKSVFRFSYEQPDPDAGDTDDGLDDFAPEMDPMLAFAARCTSSFPVAFAPMRYTDMPQNLQNEKFRRFFPDADFAMRSYADGGYLDNRPFSHAIDLIPIRASHLPGQRKLLFIDPFPENPTATENDRAGPLQPIDFLTNAKLAATTLPRQETIREDIRSIIQINRRLERLYNLQKRFKDDGRILPKHRPPRNDNLERLDLLELIESDELAYGRGYPYYHHLRIYDATDKFANYVAHLAGYDPQSDEFSFMRLFIREWRDAKFKTYKTDGRFPVGAESEFVFLNRYDIGYRHRRLVHLRAQIDQRLAETRTNRPGLVRLRKTVETELRRLRHLSQPPERQDKGADQTLLKDVLSKHFENIMSIPGLNQRQDAVNKLYLGHGLPMNAQIAIDRVLDGIGKEFCALLDASSTVLRNALDNAGQGADDLNDVYHEFHWHDVDTFPFLEGTPAEEHAEVQIFRISPADSSLNKDPKKLMGINLHAFGGFLSREWREHDILWGRLDGADQIINALLPGADRQAERAEYIERLHTAILRQEFGAAAGGTRQLALLKAKLQDPNFDEQARAQLAAAALGAANPRPMDQRRFVEYYRDVRPVNPLRSDLTAWARRAFGILSRMTHDLVNDGSGSPGWLAKVGMISFALVQADKPRASGDRIAVFLYLMLIMTVVGGVICILSRLNLTAIPMWPGVILFVVGGTPLLAVTIARRFLNRAVANTLEKMQLSAPGIAPVSTASRLQRYGRAIAVGAVLALAGLGALTSYKAVTAVIIGPAQAQADDPPDAAVAAR